MDNHTKEQRHKNMIAIKSRDTKIEVSLRLALWHKGIRYRKNYKVLDCRPDIVLTKYKIAIFCDGEFWHGKTFERCDVTTNVKFWHDKIRRNMERDLENTIELRDNGWTVLRFWETDIKKHLEDCVAEVLKNVEMKKGSNHHAHLYQTPI